MPSSSESRASVSRSSFKAYALCLASISLIIPFSLSFLECRVRAVFIEMKGLPMFCAIVKQEMKTCLRESGSNSTVFSTSFFNLGVKQVLKLSPSYPGSAAFHLCALIVSLCKASQDTARILHKNVKKRSFFKVGVHTVL